MSGRTPAVPYVIIDRGAAEHDHLPQVTIRMDGDVENVFPPAVAARNQR